MTDVLFFHHIQGLTPGMIDLANRFRAAGHTVHSPDLFEGRTFTSIEAGAGFTESEGAPDLAALADAAAARLPDRLVYLGISLGVMSAQRLAQTRGGAAGAVLLDACIPVTGEWAFGPWPAGVPIQVHGAAADSFFAGEGDIDAARELVSTAGDAELFVYPGDQHLMWDSSLPQYDAGATDLLVERVVSFLGRL